MKKHQPEIFFKKRVRAIETLLNKLSVRLTSENIHKLRVEFKIIFAIHDLTKYCSKKFKRNKNQTTINKFFKKAGIVRDLYIEIVLLKAYAKSDPASKYISYLKKRYTKEAKIFSNIINKNIFKKLNKEFSNSLPSINNVDQKCIGKYLRKRKSKIQTLINTPSLNEDQVHDLRKKLKELFYIEKYLAKTEWTNNIKDMNVFQTLMGEWHDLRFTIEHIDNSIQKELFIPVELSAIKKIKRRLNSESRKMLREINISKYDLTI